MGATEPSCENAIDPFEIEGVYGFGLGVRLREVGDVSVESRLRHELPGREVLGAVSNPGICKSSRAVLALEVQSPLSLRLSRRSCRGAS